MNERSSQLSSLASSTVAKKARVVSLLCFSSAMVNAWPLLLAGLTVMRHKLGTVRGVVGVKNFVRVIVNVITMQPVNLVGSKLLDNFIGVTQCAEITSTTTVLQGVWRVVGSFGCLCRHV